MRPVSLALPAVLLSLTLAAAASPEEAYVAARDAAFAKIRKLEAGGAVNTDKEQRKLLADLEKRLRSIVGGLSAAGYPATGKIASDGLSENEVGAGLLDSLRFSKGDGGPQAYVTTDGLFDNWLRTQADYWKKAQKSVPTIDEALENDEFYAEAIAGDAAFSKTADIQIEKPEGASYVVAMLGGWAQDIGPTTEQNIIVAVRRNGKVYIADQTSKKAKPIAVCEAIWTEAMKKSEGAPGTHVKESEDQRSFEASSAILDKGDKDYRACYAARAPKEAFFAELTAEAQSIANRFKAP